MNTSLRIFAMLTALLLQAQDPMLDIVAQPSAGVAWDKLEVNLAGQGINLKSVQLKPPVYISRDLVSGELFINISPSILIPDKDHPETLVESAAWAAYTEAKMPQNTEGKTAFQVELDAWIGALKATDEVVREKKLVPKDPRIIKFSIFRRDKQLEAAIYTLLYEDKFKNEFEKWKISNPNGIKEFITKYRLRPDFAQQSTNYQPVFTTKQSQFNFKVLNTLIAKHDDRNSKCRFKNVICVQLLYKDPGKGADRVGSTFEAWTIEGCNGKRFIYKVQIIPFDGHNILFISNIDNTSI